MYSSALMSIVFHGSGTRIVTLECKLEVWLGSTPNFELTKLERFVLMLDLTYFRIKLTVIVLNVFVIL